MKKPDRRRIKAKRDRQRRARKKDAERRRKATESGHMWSCARKNRYPTREVAETAALRCEAERGVPLRVYHCDACGGWHLTHREKRGNMTPSEVLQRSREAAIRVRGIDEELVALEERIGPQGHGYEYHEKSGIRDPMDKLLDKLDESLGLESERAECMKDVMAAERLIDGIGAMDDTGKPMTDAEYLLRAWFVEGKDLAAVSKGSGVAADKLPRVIDGMLEWADGVGIGTILRARQQKSKK